MFRRPLFLTALLALPGAALVLVTNAAPPACRLQVIPDYVTPVSYQAVLRPSPACQDGTVLRVRKSSTLNTRVNGAPVQPIRPLKGAWEVGKNTLVNAPVPWRELTTITVTRWRWEWFDASAPNPLTLAKGRWVAAEVLRAAP